MKIVLITLSIIGLLLNLVPSFLVFAKAMDWNTHINLMTAGTIIWFLTVPFWMKKGDQA